MLCNTFDLHSAIIGLENQFLVFGQASSGSKLLANVISRHSSRQRVMKMSIDCVDFQGKRIQIFNKKYIL